MYIITKLGRDNQIGSLDVDQYVLLVPKFETVRTVSPECDAVVVLVQCHTGTRGGLRACIVYLLPPSRTISMLR